MITDTTLRVWLARNISGQGGGARPARTLGVSESTASNLLREKPSAPLVKLAAHSGYERLDNIWIESDTRRDPRDVRYQHRWTQLVIDELRELMKLPKDKRPRVSALAKKIGVSPSRLRGVMAAAHIKLRQEDRP